MRYGAGNISSNMQLLKSSPTCYDRLANYTFSTFACPWQHYGVVVRYGSLWFVVIFKWISGDGGFELSSSSAARQRTSPYLGSVANQPEANYQGNEPQQHPQVQQHRRTRKFAKDYSNTDDPHTQFSIHSILNSLSQKATKTTQAIPGFVIDVTNTSNDSHMLSRGAFQKDLLRSTFKIALRGLWRGC